MAYEAELRDINKQAVSQWFVPTVDFLTMTCETMQKNYDKLVNQISMWQIRYDGTSDGAARKNLQSILDIQSKKLEGYRSALNDCADIAAQIAAENDPNKAAALSEGPPLQDKNKKYIKLLLIGMGVFFFLVFMIWLLRRHKK